MARAQVGTIITMKIRVEVYVVAPLRIGLEIVIASPNRAAAGGIACKNARQPPGYLRGDLIEIA
jgi:hypothetical protein